MAHLAQSWRLTRGIMIALAGVALLVVAGMIWVVTGRGVAVAVVGSLGTVVFLAGVARAVVAWLGHVGAVAAFVPPLDPPLPPQLPPVDEPFFWEAADPQLTQITLHQRPGLDLAGDRIRLLAVEARPERGRGAVMARRDDADGTWVPAEYVIRLGGAHWRITPSPAHVLDRVTLTRVIGRGEAHPDVADTLSS